METVPAGTCELIYDLCYEVTRPEVLNAVEAMKQAWPDAATHELLAQILIGRLASGILGPIQTPDVSTFVPSPEPPKRVDSPGPVQPVFEALTADT